MSYISRSQWIKAKLETLLNGEEKEISILLYPSEKRRFAKRCPQLAFVVDPNSESHENDKRVNCKVSK